MPIHEMKTRRFSGQELSPYQQLGMIVSALFKADELVEVRAVRSASSEAKGVSRVVERAWLQPQELLQRYAAFVKMNESGANIYFGVNPRLRCGGSKEHISLTRCMWADVDSSLPDATLKRWAGIVPEPSIVIASGHGTHAYWLLETDSSMGRHEDRVDFEARLKNLYRDLGADSTQDVSRLLRLPGFFNTKRGKSPCVLLACDTSRQYSLNAFDRWTKPASVTASQFSATTREDLPNGRDTRRIRGLIRHLGVPVPNRSKRDFAVLCGLLRMGLDADGETIWSLVQGHSKFKEGGKRYFETTLQNALRRLEVCE